MNNPALALLWEAFQENRGHRAPVTYSVIGFVVGMFAVELVFTYQYDLASTRVFATGLFGVAPTVAWALSPFLHKGVFHFFASLLGLWLLGLPIEQSWGRWQYAIFLLGSGYLATAAGVALLVPFTAQDVAFYGSSGMIYALSGFAVVYYPRWFGEVRKSEWLAVFVGAVGLLYVLVDLVTGPFLTAEWVNGGHLGGLVVGVLVGFLEKRF